MRKRGPPSLIVIFSVMAKAVAAAMRRILDVEPASSVEGLTQAARYWSNLLRRPVVALAQVEAPR